MVNYLLEICESLGKIIFWTRQIYSAVYLISSQKRFEEFIDYISLSNERIFDTIVITEHYQINQLEIQTWNVKTPLNINFQVLKLFSFVAVFFSWLHASELLLKMVKKCMNFHFCTTASLKNETVYFFIKILTLMLHEQFYQCGINFLEQKLWYFVWVLVLRFYSRPVKAKSILPTYSIFIKKISISYFLDTCW